MATLVDPDLLRLRSVSAGVAGEGEVFIKPADFTIQLASQAESASSNFTATDGVSLQALYSFLKEQWKNNDTDDFFRYRFPMEAITAEQYEFINDWAPAEDTTRSYIRTGGWSERKSGASKSTKQIYAGIVTLGTISSTQTAYYAFFDTSTSSYITSKSSFQFAGVVNEAVQIFGDADNGNFDYRNNRLDVFIRPDPTGSDDTARGFTFGNSDTEAIGIDTLTNQVYRFPLQSLVDLNINLTDTQVASIITALSLEIRFDQASLSSSLLPIDLNNPNRDFTHRIGSSNVSQSSLTPTQFYHFVQYSLRQDSNINDDGSTSARTGALTEPLVTFVGNVLETFAINGGTEGVLLDDFATNQTANLKLRDNTNTLQAFPTVAAGTITFNQNLQDDPSTRYFMFYKSASSGESVWPGATAKLVPDFNGNDITGYLHNTTATPATGSASSTGGSVTAGGFVLTQSSGEAAWTVDDYNDKVLEYVSGTSTQNVGYYNILDTSASTITVERAFEETDAAVNYIIRDRNTTGISWDFNFDNATIRNDGLTSLSADVVVVALGLEQAQYVNADFTINNGAAQSFPLTAPLERNYNDPV